MRHHRRNSPLGSALKPSNTGLIVAVAGILLTLFLMTNILPLVDTPDKQRHCDMVRVLYDLDKRPRFTRPTVNIAADTHGKLDWVAYRTLGDYRGDNVLVPAANAPVAQLEPPARGINYQGRGEVVVRVRHHMSTIKDNISEVLNETSRQHLGERSLFEFLRAGLGTGGEFHCEAINNPEGIAMLVSSVIDPGKATDNEVYDLPALGALLLKRSFADRTTLELLYPDQESPDNGLISVTLDGRDKRLEQLVWTLLGYRAGS